MLSLVSPAKINLFLRILRKRPDGYHELASLFQAVSLCDQLRFAVADRDSFTCTDPSLPTDQSNLVIKALYLFRRKTGIETPFQIHLDKRIPAQAGLGGGSSNAATTLWAVNQLCGQPATDEELRIWGAEIGSDISFFLSTGTAYCTGRGEKIRSLPALPKMSLVIVKPSHNLSTPQVYGRLQAASLPPRDPEKALQEHLQGRPSFFNDLEGPALELCPEVGELKERLLAGGFSQVLMSGSGSSFFCLGEGRLPAIPGLKHYKCTFLNRAPGAWYC